MLGHFKTKGETMKSLGVILCTGLLVAGVLSFTSLVATGPACQQLAWHEAKFGERPSPWDAERGGVMYQKRVADCDAEKRAEALS